MKQDLKIQGLSKLGHYLQQFLQKSEIRKRACAVYKCYLKIGESHDIK